MHKSEKVSVHDILIEMDPVIREIQEEYAKLSDSERKDFEKYILDVGMREGRKLWDMILHSQNQIKQE